MNVYTEKTTFGSLKRQCKSIHPCIVHEFNGVYKEVIAFVGDKETIIAFVDEEYWSFENIQNNSNKYCLYHLVCGDYILSSKDSAFISINDKPTVLDYKFIPHSEAVKSKHYHEDPFFDQLVEDSFSIKKDFRAEIRAKQINEASNAFTCTICKKTYKNIYRNWLWCKTPYGENHETYKVLACPHCIKKAEGNDKYIYSVQNAMMWGLGIVTFACAFYAMFYVFEATLLWTLAISVVCAFFAIISIQDSTFAEKFLRVIGFVNYVDKEKARQLAGLVSGKEMYEPRVSDEDYKRLKDLSDEVVFLISDVCPDFYSQAIFYFGKNLLQDRSIPLEIKKRILVKARNIAESKRAIYTSKLYKYIQDVALNIEKIESNDFSYKRPTKPSLAFYVIIANLFIKELVTTYRSCTNQCALMDTLADGSQVPNRYYTCILTNIGVIENHSLLHSIHYIIDQTIEYDPILECTRAIYNVVNEYGDSSVILDENKMQAIVANVKANLIVCK